MKQKHEYTILDKYILRTPVLSILDVDDLTIEKIKLLCAKPFISEAIYIASPDLHKEMLKVIDKNNDKPIDSKLVYTLMKYLLRMGNRSTPFGLFSGCSLGEFSSENNIEVGNVDSHKRVTRLDMDYLCALSQNIENDKEVRPYLLYYKNSSLYKLGDELRYVEYRYQKSLRRHFTVSIDYSEFIDELLIIASAGSSINILAEIITRSDSDISIEAAESFVHELIDNQILISSISPSLTGNDYFDILRSNIPTKKYRRYFSQMNDVLSKINSDEINFSLSHYSELESILDKVGTEYNKKFLLQTDLHVTCDTNKIKKTNLNNVKSAVAFLNKLNSTIDNGNLDKFKARFYEIYEDEEVPLALVLDVESGIGYPVNREDIFDVSPLIDDLNMSSRIINENNNFNEISWSRKDDMLNKKISNINSNCLEIELKDSDVESLEEDWGNLPSTFSVSLNILESTENDALIYLNSVGGATATFLLGRFCHIDKEIEEHVREIVSLEENNNNFIYAEILHLPENRAGNILYRPQLRKYEIPYLAKSNLPMQNQINIEDIMISIQNDVILLRSKKYNKYIAPKMATAHNYSERSLPIYHFLCDMQYQNIKDFISFSWDNVYRLYNYFPRVKYKGVILSTATWIIKKATIEKICGNKNYLTKWRNEENIPSKVFLKEFDNTLPIYFDHDLSVEMFKSTIKNKNQITISENLFNSNKSLVNTDNKPFTNEVILSFTKN